LPSYFGRRRVKGKWVDQVANPSLPPDRNTEPPQVYLDRSKRCIGCPYAKHGYTCYSSTDGSCIRTDMERLERKRNRQV